MGRYLPGYKDGGPVRSTQNLVEQLGKEYDIRVAAYDRDVGDTQQYPNIKLYSWNRVGNGLVYYIPEEGFTCKVLQELAAQVDIVYLWGCFNSYTIKVLLLKRLKIIKPNVAIAGMGLFSPKAFQIKYWKKKTVTTIMNFLGLFQNVYWSATSELEVQEIRHEVWSKSSQFYIAEDLPRKVDESLIEKTKLLDELNIVWISRIAPKKNLKAAIHILNNTKAKIKFTIYGPVFDQEYWNRCQQELSRLPENIQWEYKGSVDSEQVVSTLMQYHVFLFPTLGENYGHVIQESLSAGCPCLLSDQTPWKDLEENGAGYVFPLEKKSCFVKVLEKYAAMDQEEFNEVIHNAHTYAITKSNEKVKNTGYRLIFDDLSK